MGRRIADFFLLDLIDEQHKFSIDEIALIYESNTDEVIAALVRANERYANNPLSSCYNDSERNACRHIECEISKPPSGDVPSHPGEARVENGKGMVVGGSSA